MPKGQHGGRREGAGRKPLDPEERRSESIQTTVTPGELAEIASEAEGRGLTISDYTRLRILGRRLPAFITKRRG
jgi:hypothetical protein